MEGATALLPEGGEGLELSGGVPEREEVEEPEAGAGTAPFPRRALRAPQPSPTAAKTAWPCCAYPKTLSVAF